MNNFVLDVFLLSLMPFKENDSSKYKTFLLYIMNLLDYLTIFQSYNYNFFEILSKMLL